MHKGGDGARTILVTGTDTGVGKTVVVALLAQLLRENGVKAGVMKPVGSGGLVREGRLVSPDAIFLREMLGLGETLEAINPVCYAAPLAPHVAAAREGRRLDLEALYQAFVTLKKRCEALIVEGVGGLLVPLDGRFTVCDLALRWALPILVVARPGLGTINHTALTLLQARARGLGAAGFLFNARTSAAEAADVQANQECIEAICGVPFWGTIPYGGTSLREPLAWTRLLEEAKRAAGPHLFDYFTQAK